MPALIPELIAMASDPAVTTSDLLRRALVAAHRLKLPEWIDWITHELQGYPEGVALPQYRRLQGEIVADIPMRGLTQVSFSSAHSASEWGFCNLDTPVEEIEGWLNEGDDVVMTFAPEVEDALRKAIRPSCRPLRRFHLSMFKALIGAVRNKVLAWALKLEGEGILGEGLSFTAREQAQAQQLAPVTHIHIEGGFHGGQLMAGSPRGQQQQTVTSEQKVEALEALLPLLVQVIAEGKLQQTALADLRANHAALQALASSSVPNWSVIGVLAGSVQSILEGAGGGVLAAQALGWLTTLTAG
ncbi:hypothetical protein GRF56_11865 [Aeromonas veronii]|uniref:AbiTii domain-containing protein n=1 Tax=Aeromonas veronii TaxID=654 RepID=UPI001319AA07|nr:hypothetical protein [Aeromonas veronii]QHC08059.1 hypothetical protein GRF56_11865 [Aeromonas veronii]